MLLQPSPCPSTIEGPTSTIMGGAWQQFVFCEASLAWIRSADLRHATSLLFHPSSDVGSVPMTDRLGFDHHDNNNHHHNGRGHSDENKINEGNVPTSSSSSSFPSSLARWQPLHTHNSAHSKHTPASTPGPGTGPGLTAAQAMAVKWGGQVRLTRMNRVNIMMIIEIN